MIEKVVKKWNLNEIDEIQENLKYWLSKTPEERLSAVELLRRQIYGKAASARIQKVCRIIQLGKEEESS